MDTNIATVNCVGSILGLALGVWALYWWSQKRWFDQFIPMNVSKAKVVAKLIFIGRVRASGQLRGNVDELNVILKPEVHLTSLMGMNWQLRIWPNSPNQKDLKINAGHVSETKFREKVLKNLTPEQEKAIDSMVESLEQTFQSPSPRNVNESLDNIWKSPPSE